jgi:NADH-quinone oxidoreductase subunit G
VAAEGLRKARDGAYGVGVLTGGRLTVEDAYAYSKFARAVLHTNDIDFRARPHSPEEADFLAACVASTTDVTYSDVDTAPAVVLVGLEPEDECPILFLRLRKSVAKRGMPVHAVAPFVSRGSAKLDATVLVTEPGAETAALRESTELRDALSQPGAILFVGERLAGVPGALSAAAALASQTSAALAWVPRRAGDRGAVDAGCLPNLLPGGRPIIDAAARAEIGDAWGLKTGTISGSVGRDGDAIIAAAASGKLGALVVAGVDPSDLADPVLADEALDKVDFLVSFEVRRSAVARRADVVFPVAPVAEKAGTFLNWEGRLRTFPTALETTAMTDARVLDALAREMGSALGCSDVAAIRRELGALPVTDALRAVAPHLEPPVHVRTRSGTAMLATWAQLIDLASLLDGDGLLADTARPVRALLSKETAAAAGVGDGDHVRVATDRGSIDAPVEVTDMPDGVVWLPTNSPGSTVRRTLGAAHGSVVTLSAATGGDR